ncbi:hypothetical protein JCM16814_07510 [Desulfobaculum senezii]|jgi:hypothetical protein
MKNSLFSDSGLRRNGWKIGYFAAGILFIPLSRLFVPFWVRFPLLAAWAIGLAVILARQLSRPDDSSGS